MNKTKAYVVLLFILLLLLFFAGCGRDSQPNEVIEAEQKIILQAEGILIIQSDSQMVDIVIDGQKKVFSIAEGVSITGISDGSAVYITYVEEGTQKIILSIEPTGAVINSEGIFVGLIDSHSVEIVVDNEAVAFELNDQDMISGIDDGSYIAFTYEDREHRPLLLSVETIKLEGEGVFVGQVDSQSIEIEMKRAFAFGDGVGREGIADGSLVEFDYFMSGQRAVLKSIKAVNEITEGDSFFGILIGQIDTSSVEIHYFQVFALDDEVSLENIEDGSWVLFNYRESCCRPVINRIIAE